MFEVGDKVKYVGTSRHRGYQNLGVGVVTYAGSGSFWPVNVVFEGYDYGPESDYHVSFHPCDFDELEKCDGDEKLINIYVVWVYDGPILTTLLQFEDSDIQRQAMQQWTTRDYVQQAFDAEFSGDFSLYDSYELAAIFEAPVVKFIY